MSKALAVFHGRFGRATVYQLNRPFNMHAHREGHLIFHVGPTTSLRRQSRRIWPRTPQSAATTSRWERSLV